MVKVVKAKGQFIHKKTPNSVFEAKSIFKNHHTSNVKNVKKFQAQTEHTKSANSPKPSPEGYQNLSKPLRVIE